MSHIDAVFNQRAHKALIAYVTMGYPDIEYTRKLIPLLAENGCDIIELGIPFSDPLADGATIQKASYQALCNGVTPALCLEIASEAKRNVEKPLVFMTYYNPVLSYGLDKFCVDCVTSSIDGLIIPDLPAGESVELETVTGKRGLDLIYLLAPNSDEKRIKLVASKSTGFIYLVSVTGITGARQRLPPDLAEFVSRVRKAAQQPLCVGFGISDPVQATQIARFADGVIIGSRIIQLIEEDNSLKKLKDFLGSLRSALNSIQ